MSGYRAALCAQTVYDYITRRRAVAAAGITIITHHKPVITSANSPRALITLPREMAVQ